MRMAILCAAVPAAGGIDGILTYGISHMQGIGGLKSWQWTFLLEGLPIIPLGVLVYVLLDKIPNAVQWLGNIEKQLLTNLLRDDTGVADSEPIPKTRISWRQVRYVFIDWQIYLYSMIAGGILAALKSLTTLLPTLFETTGYTKTETHLMTTLPYAVACVCALLVGYSSSHRNEHGYHLLFCLSIALLGFILMFTLSNQDKVVICISSTVSCCGVLSALSLPLSWLTNNIGGHTKRSMAISFVMGIGQIGGIFMPLIYRDVDKPTYRRGHAICGGLIAVSMAATIILWICLMKENNRRTNLSPEEYTREATIKEPCDRHPDVRYSL
ncbi:unnamed protein product [Rotaria sordida]|uniref:Uncharacterized protein n=1 Tax=Rotaria sordida TaxID=392033 RepID=A0A814IF44_9BILA|nr:unnamed protein product [Rotaria sordida]CAF1079715.1 unnamed protein product [Rotaria sordida]